MAVCRFRVFVFRGGWAKSVASVSPLQCGWCMLRGHDQLIFGHQQKNRRFALLSLDFAVWRFAGLPVSCFCFSGVWANSVASVSPLQCGWCMCRGHDQVIFPHKKKSAMSASVSGLCGLAVCRFAGFVFLFFGGLGQKCRQCLPSTVWLVHV